MRKIVQHYSRKKSINSTLGGSYVYNTQQLISMKVNQLSDLHDKANMHLIVHVMMLQENDVLIVIMQAIHVQRCSRERPALKWRRIKSTSIIMWFTQCCRCLEEDIGENLKLVEPGQAALIYRLTWLYTGSKGFKLNKGLIVDHADNIMNNPVPCCYRLSGSFVGRAINLLSSSCWLFTTGSTTFLFFILTGIRFKSDQLCWCHIVMLQS